MNERRVARRTAVKKIKSLEDELMELDDAMAQRKPLDFQSYQEQVMQQTSPWPIPDPKLNWRKIIRSAEMAMEETNGENQIIHTAHVLLLLSQLADSVPIALERIAHISLSHEMPRMKNIENPTYDTRAETGNLKELTGPESPEGPRLGP